MLKKILVLLVLLIGSYSYGFDFSNSNIDINRITGSDRFELIQNIKQNVETKNYDNNINSQYFKQLVKSHTKDTNYPDNYYATQCGYSNLRHNKLTPIYYKNTDIMLYYTVQEPQNFRIRYTYTIFGNLKFIDILDENYPNYPYSLKEYTTSGNFVNIQYYINDKTYVIFAKNKKAEIYYKNKLLEKIGV